MILNKMGQTESKPPPEKGTDFFTTLLIINLVIVIINFLRNLPNKRTPNLNISLEDVVGLEDVKEEIYYYMEFLNNSNDYTEWEVSVPRGVLLIGPPGTGKTLLVKAIAKSLEIPVVSASGSEFIEKYVGVGASRIRKLFSKARAKKKCIIFIDEIDAIGQRRDSEINSERSSTLNQLLVEMDGFDTAADLIVFAATNFVQNLDPALLRSGRFDKKVYFDLPNMKERKSLFKLYLKNAPVCKNLSYKSLSERSAGLSGADIANIVNQSKINAIQRKTEKINDEDIQEALDEVMIGREKRERMLTKEELNRVAHHEAGHALMSYLLFDSEPPIKVSIIPRGQHALGFSQSKPKLRRLETKSHILSRIAVLLGGRTAEIIFFGEVSTGASDDIEKISVLAERYHTYWGMSSDFGPFNPNHVGIDKDIILESCQNLIEKLEIITNDVLFQNKKLVAKIAKKLLQKETILGEEIAKICGKSIKNTINICDIFE